MASEPPVPLIFIHGIKGATLNDANGREVWLSRWQALGLSSPDLALPLAWNGDSQASDSLAPGEILSWIPIIPFYRAAVYGPWLDAARGLGRPFFPFAYDWRRDNRETAARFESFLEQVRRSTGAARVEVVAHSMGGLITLSVLNRRPELFHSVVFAGVPFDGGIGFLPDLQKGTANGLNKKILSPSVLATFPSVYSLFPNHGGNLLGADGGPVSVDFYHAEDWKRLRLGPYSRNRKPSADFEVYFDRALAAALRFRESLKPAAVSYPPIGVVCGNHFPTIRNAVEKGNEWSFPASQTSPGDGRVPEQTCLPPAPLAYKLFESKAEHSDLLNDPAVIDWIRAFP